MLGALTIGEVKNGDYNYELNQEFIVEFLGDF